MMKDALLHYAKRLADYVRMDIEIGTIDKDSPVGIAWRDFMIESKLLDSFSYGVGHGEKEEDYPEEWIEAKPAN